MEHNTLWTRHTQFWLWKNYCYGCILMTFMLTVQGAFHADPPHISPTETTHLTLKCVPDTQGIISVLVIQIKRKLGESMSQVNRRKRSIGATFIEATVNSKDEVGVIPNINRFKVNGKMEDSAFLAVTMEKPDADDAGNYECIVTMLGSDQVKVAKESVTVTATKILTLEGLDRRIETLEHQIPTMAAMGQSMQSIVEQDRGKNKALIEQVESLKRENKDLLQSVDELMKKFQGLSDRTTALMEEQKLEMDQLKRSHDEQKVKQADMQEQLRNQQNQQQQQKQQQQQHQEPEEQAHNDDTQLGNSNSQQGLTGDSTTITDTNVLDDTGQIGDRKKPVPGAYNNNFRPNNFNGMPPNNNGFMNNPYNPNGFQNSFNNNNGYNNYNNNGYNNYNNGFNNYNNRNGFNNGPRGMPYNNGGGYLPPGNPQPQYGNYPPYNNNNNNNNYNNYNNNQRPVQPPMYGNGPAGPIPPSIPHLKSDDLFKIKARMDDLENIRLASLEQQMDELRHQWVEPMSDRIENIEVYINATLKPKVKHCVDQADFDDIQRKVIILEGDVLPRLTGNVTDLQKHIVTVHRAMDLLKGLKSATDEEVAKILKQVENVNPSSQAWTKGSTEPSTASNPASVETGESIDSIPTSPYYETSSPTSASTTTPSSGMRCYVCGNNKTQESCIRQTNDDEGWCPEGMDYCMTNIYQDGLERSIYKRCATKADCKAVKDSDPKCARTAFLTLDPITCHFCCVSELCNNSLRPTKDLYKLG